MSTLQKYILVSAVFLLYLTSVPAQGQINVLEYFPLNIGDVFTYDDSSRAEITRTVELDWLNNVTAYEKVWTNNPNPEITDVRHYFIISGDSLFLASAHGTQDNVAFYGKFDPPVLLGTANTTPGDTLTTSGIIHGVDDGLPYVIDSSIVQVVVNWSGLASVPYGTFEDCITMTVILMPLDEEERDEILNVILAKDIGIIYGSELDIACDLAPVHSLSDFQQGVTPQGDVNENGKVDIFDLLELLKVLGGSSQATEGADVNEDGKVDIFDLLQLLKILSGSTVSLASTGSKLSGTYKGMEYEFGERFKITFADGSKMEFSQNISSPEEIQATGGIAASISDNAEKFESSVLPKNFSLAQNHPNPFNPTTTISYTIPDGAPAHVTLKIYSLRGHLVKTLVASIMDSGIHIVFWDGTDESGRQVSSGVYLYRMQAGEFTQTRKMVIVK